MRVTRSPNLRDRVQRLRAFLRQNGRHLRRNAVESVPGHADLDHAARSRRR